MQVRRVLVTKQLVDSVTEVIQVSERILVIIVSVSKTPLNVVSACTSSKLEDQRMRSRNFMVVYTKFCNV